MDMLARGWGAPIGRREGFSLRDLPFVLPLFGLVYFAVAKLGMFWGLAPSNIVILWPPNAVVAVMLLHVRRALWPFFAVVGALAEGLAGSTLFGPDATPLRALAFGLLNFAEAGAVALFLRQGREGAVWLPGLPGFLRYLLAGPVLAAGVVAMAGAALTLQGFPDEEYLKLWRIFWFGDALGLLVVGTPLLVWLGQAQGPAPAPGAAAGPRASRSSPATSAARAVPVQRSVSRPSGPERAMTT